MSTFGGRQKEQTPKFEIRMEGFGWVLSPKCRSEALISSSSGNDQVLNRSRKYS